MLTPQQTPFYFCAYFGENRSSNATVRVRTDGYTDRPTDSQTQAGFMIYPMLYAIAMGQIIALTGKFSK